ncbi:putative N-6 adenine-specific DNA methyltransferase 2 [Glarea lozoyensis ATCC 20868]|uniref:Protein-lysine N-methyltransferase EFM5 n=1 Tax=Glarea lozoyensis (strain ATCC 20868 / MF5171) TaxID=1116229 RepID=S3CMJ0_GLAL2|nr:putative N-6 adenine-specific DNA methyltransferase 2 [Glarea lozoyensis ATCC 20868]EPE26945.1 putative N-6 adenine-specific DNA methyltransferase 2 [Glarea lozoyensis ATCC 20868]
MAPDDDEPITLSGNALSALQEFYSDRDALAQKFEDLKKVAEDDFDGDGQKEVKTLSMDAFGESWQDSQFWYSDETATLLAEQLLEGATAETTIAVVSAPSTFIQIKNILNKEGKPLSERPKVWLLEYDKRFEVFKDEFLFYDFKFPLKLPPNMVKTVDRFIIDPPFLSEDCQTKAAMTVRYLAKSWPTSAPQDSRLIVCTGERMETLINKLYRPTGIATTDYLPVHSKGLSNEFFCYANFECSAWKWKAEEKKSNES